MQWTFVKILKDNYVWLLYNDQKEAIIIDCGDYNKVKQFLDINEFKLKYILITHAHDDHISGVKELAEETGALVVGNGKYSDRLPPLDITIEEFHEQNFLGQRVEVFPTPGHCADHVSYYFKDLGLLFVGDFIFSLGCGRIFEGTPMDMLQSFNLIRDLPKDTLVFPSHEYTKSNLNFVKTIGFFDLGERELEITSKDITLPSNLGFELKCNPFLNVSNEEFKDFLTHNPHIDDVSFFYFLRELKNKTTNLVGG